MLRQTVKSRDDRSLDKLHELGLLRRVEHPGSTARFDANSSPHHHFLCTRCGAIEDLPLAAVQGHEDLALVAAAHNDNLVRVLNAFYELTLPRRRRYFAVLRRGQASHRQHHRIVDAIRSRATRKGVALMQRHMETARFYWREELGGDAPAPGRRPR